MRLKEIWFSLGCAVTLFSVHLKIETLSRKVEGLDPTKP